MISPGSSPRCVRRNIPPGNVVVPNAPPPLPPRKSSPTHEQTMLPTTSSQQINHHRNSMNNCSSGGLSEAQSVTNLTHNTIEIPQIISKSNSMLEMHRNNGAENNNDNFIELSTPETITGIVSSRCDNIIEINKSPASRHLSCPSTRSATQNTIIPPVKSNTTPNISSQTKTTTILETPATTNLLYYENIELEIPPKHTQNKHKRINPLERDSGTVSYENLNMDYIKKLVSEGYSQDSVIKALGITRNNVDMACDILHEFGTKLG